MLRALLVTLFALVVGAFHFVPTVPPRATVDARTTVKVEMSATFYDVGLDNPTIPDDKDAQPARKCASCFG